MPKPNFTFHLLHFISILFNLQAANFLNQLTFSSALLSFSLPPWPVPPSQKKTPFRVELDLYFITGKEMIRKAVSFLGPAGASLVDLDDLISSKPRQHPLTNTPAPPTQAMGKDRKELDSMWNHSWLALTLVHQKRQQISGFVWKSLLIPPPTNTITPPQCCVVVSIVFG